MGKTNVSSILIGVAGEYFVAAELSRLGYIASITLRNTKGIDIIATNERGTRAVNIQVKTKGPGKRKWMLSEKAESIKEENIFYVFVALKEPKTRPEYFICPSSHVARSVRKSHKTWLETPGRRGQVRKDNKIRNWHDKEKNYLEKWELLGLDEG